MKAPPNVARLYGTLDPPHQYLFCEISNGRLPLEDGSDRRETLGKRVSDDSGRSIFRRQKKKMDENILIENLVFCRFGQVLEALGPNGPQNHLRNQILLQIHPS